MEYICLNCGQVNSTLECTHCGHTSSEKVYEHVMEQAHRAIRYGYFYRREAEKAKEHDGLSIHYSLTTPANGLEWIATLVISGVSYDIIKYLVKKLYSYIKSKINPNNKDEEKVIEIFEKEEELQLFVKYTKEFHAGLKDVDSKIIDYIQEEINADYMGKQTGDFLSKEHRVPNAQDLLKIMKDRKNSDIDIHYREELQLFLDLKRQLSNRQTKS